MKKKPKKAVEFNVADDGLDESVFEELDLKNTQNTLDPRLAEHTESLSLDTLICVISERVTNVEIGWADGACRVELRCGRRRWIGRGPKAAIALARAMNIFDLTNSSEDEVFEYGKGQL